MKDEINEALDKEVVNDMGEDADPIDAAHYRLQLSAGFHKGWMAAMVSRAMAAKFVRTMDELSGVRFVSNEVEKGKGDEGNS